MEITPELINAWKFELAKQVQQCQSNAREASSEYSRETAQKKADFLEGFYTVLTCFQRAANLPIE